MSAAPQDLEGPAVESLDAWLEAGFHTITLPSGTRVGVRIPDLSALIEAGELPQHLLDAALGSVEGSKRAPAKKITVEDLKREREFTDYLVAKTVVKPDLTAQQAGMVPTEDKEMIVQIATRQRDLDALGDHIGGLDRSEKFRRFRRLGEFDPALEGLS